MGEQDLSALFLTSEADIRYVTGFLTRFFESPTRPWYVIVPVAGTPIAVIPEIGRALMESCWINDIRTWDAPNYTNDGISLLHKALYESAGLGPIGVPMALESHLRMPLADWNRLNSHDLRFVSDNGVMAGSRAIKSEAEIAKIRTACAIANRAFARVPEIAVPGVALEQVFRDFQALALQEGADWVGYLAGAADQGGYADVISPATSAPLQPGDVLMLDTGLVHDGYYCDFDRNFSIGPPTERVKTAISTLVDAVDAAVEVARPGTRAGDLYHAMDKVLTGGTGASAGRLGHGLGLQLTEGLSLIAEDDTVLEAGMVSDA